MLLRAIAIWCVILIGAFVNGMFRVTVLIPAYGDTVAHTISTMILCGVIVIATFKSIRWLHPETRAHALEIGVVWLMLTLAFEFLAGHYVFGNSWERLLADYNLRDGRIWVLVLAVTLFAPMWALPRRPRFAQ